jgi:hypothetical protein
VNLETLALLNPDGDYFQTLSAIKLDAHKPDGFELMDDVAERFALYVRDRHFGFDEGGFELPDPELDLPGQKTYAMWVKQEFQDYE